MTNFPREQNILSQIRDIARRLYALERRSSAWSAGDYRFRPTADTPPGGWLLCNGQAVSRTTYADLFDEIGTTYGAGNGTTTFNIPNFTNRMPRGGTPGATGGSATKPVPPHTHSFSAQSRTPTVTYATQSGSGVARAGSDHTHAVIGTTNAASGSAFDIMPPWIGVAVFIKT